MKKLSIIFLISTLVVFSSFGQFGEVDIKVYDFEEGLSHRNVFKIAQGQSGFIWIATINGLNRFDGYNFTQFNSGSQGSTIPVDAISDMIITRDNEICLANPDFVTMLNPQSQRSEQIKVKRGDLVRRESWVPHNLFEASDGRIWMSVYDEKSADTYLQVIGRDSIPQQIVEVNGKYTKRPIAELEEVIMVGGFEHELWLFDQDGNRIGQIDLPYSGKNPSAARIVDLKVVNDKLWILLADNRIFTLDDWKGNPVLYPASKSLRGYGLANSFLVTEEENIWIVGQAMVLFYDAISKKTTNYEPQIRQVIRHPGTYRQIFRDKSGVIWLSSNFGAIKIVRSNDLFTQYLSGGSEYCSNVYCSTRGITEDDDGNVYFSYYNSIQALDPATNTVSLLFPSNSFFNYPFGITHYDGALYTGNGRKIDLTNLRVDTIFNHPNVDLGDVMVDKDGILWFGYMNNIFQYDPKQQVLTEFEDEKGKWKEEDGKISYLYQGKTRDYIWVSTLANGLYKIEKGKGRVAHYVNSTDSTAMLRHNQVNATYEDKFGYLWIGTGKGLHRLHIETDEIKVFTTQDGLPNDFINGILSEGDTCMWISTDNGLCRFSVPREDCLNFFQQDGLTANEFNRISFYKARDGRMYFGGLNGVNAFYPSPRFLEQKQDMREAPVILTQFTSYNDQDDSLHVYNLVGQVPKEINLSYWDKIISFRFALVDFRRPTENEFSYILEGYEDSWSTPSTLNLIRYNNLPSGSYTLRVRGKVAKEEWSPYELAIPIIISEVYYKTWWFWGLISLLLLGGIYALMQYRVYNIQKRRQELEEIVQARTQELEIEKKKSEDLLLNILPAETADELKKYGSARAKRHNEVTVMFSDFKGFSKISEQMEPEALVAEIDLCFRAFDEIMEKYGIEKIKTVGDAYMCVGGISHEVVEGAEQIVKAALEIQEFMKGVAVEKQVKKEPYFEARIGIHSGAVVAGIVGIKKFAYDIWGDTVNIASRMETNGAVGKVNISEATYDLINGNFDCHHHGIFNENNSGDINMYFVNGLKRSNGQKIPKPGAKRED